MVRISEEEAKRLGLWEYCPKPEKPEKERKYHNKPCEYKGLKFDSQKELDYYLILLDRQKKGEIKYLERQVKITIQPKFTTPQGETIRELYYIADFSYYEKVPEGDIFKWVFHLVDVKGGKATQTAVYKLKKKLLAYKGIYIEEV